MKTKQDTKFEAVLAKNDMAREIRDYLYSNEPINWGFMEECLQTLDAYLEPNNQPSTTDIINTREYDL